MIEINHLVKKYGNHYAVKDLSFSVEEGQIYGFLGPNGAGKSTTMNIITGYLAPTGGEVKIDGYDIMKEPEEAKSCVGYLPEIPPLYGEMTVDEYMKFAASLKKISKKEQEEQIRKAVSMTRIDDVGKRLIRNLSKGYKQRVGLAQALLGSPKVIILDEPTVGLDPKQIIEIRELIRGLKDKHTVILSSHILSEVSAICDQILILSKGQLVACDTPVGLTALMAGEEELEVTVKGSGEALKTLLDGMTEIEECRIESISGQEAKAVIKTAEKADIREKLFYLLAEKRMPLLRLNVTARTLEDVFLELTDSEQADGNKADLEQTDGNKADSEQADGNKEAQKQEQTIEQKEEQAEGEEREVRYNGSDL